MDEAKNGVMTEMSNQLEKDIKKLQKVVAIQKQEMYQASLKINHMERQLMGAMEKVDSLAAPMIVMIKRFGENNKLVLEQEELENIMPGTVIDDTQSDEEHVRLRVIEIEELREEIRLKKIEQEIEQKIEEKNNPQHFPLPPTQPSTLKVVEHDASEE